MSRLSLLLASAALASAVLVSPATASLDAGDRAGGGSPAHWIGIRNAGGVGEFFDRRSGERFVPRGANYLKLYKAADGARFDALLDPGRFDPGAIRADLQTMSDLGYNTIRVFLDLCRFECIGSSKGLNPKLLDNLATLLRLAKEEGIVVLPTVNEIDAFFSYKANLPCCKLFEGSFNRLFLTSEGLKAARNYYTDVIRGLKKRNAPLEVVLAWELRNELFLDAELPPFSLRSGKLRTGNGKIYDLGSATARRRMADENIVFFLNQMRRTIKALDPTALVTVGAHPPLPDNPARLVRIPPLRRSAVDFFDFHVGVGRNLERFLPLVAKDFGLEPGGRKPAIFGEFTAFNFVHRSPDAAARALVEWQVGSCAYGLDGWLLWLWAAGDEEVWGSLDGGGIINRELSPLERPDPCVLGRSYEPDLARGKPVTASASLPGQPAGLAVDGLFSSSWSAGAEPPQWIEIDLGVPSRISEIGLLPSQFPEGQTVHRIWGRGATGPETLLAELRAFTRDSEWLVSKPGTPWEGIRFVRVETLESPSWVSWFEIEVIGVPG